MSDLLGHLALVTVTQGPYDRRKLADRLTDLGFDVDIPATDRPINAFKKATSAPLGTYLFEGQRCSLTMVETVNTRRRIIVRTFARVMPNTAPGKKTASKTVDVLTATFFRTVDKNGSEPWRVALTANVHPDEKAQLRAIRDGLDQRIHALVELVDGDKVRNIVRDLLTSLDAVPVRNGVYFVPEHNGEAVHRLQEAFDVLPGSVVDLVPVPDSTTMQQMVTRGVVDSLTDDFLGLGGKIAQQLVRRQKISDILYATMHTSFMALTRRWNHYADRLGLQMPAQLESAADLAFDQLQLMRARGGL